MFTDMDKAFATIINFEFQKDIAYMVRTYFVRFDAIFSLNQDLLLERHYLNGNVALSSNRHWNGWEIPGMNAMPGHDSPNPATTQWSSMDPPKFSVTKNRQPYFKLHGSSNWVDVSTGRQLLVMGGDKSSRIVQHPILKWNHDQFREYLSHSDSRLMVIGYSFGDDHINRIIAEAADRGNLSLFIIDPLGVDVVDKNRDVPIYSPGPLLARLQPHLIGASRRTVRDIFGTDRVEHGKVMRFFS
jgi:hypothetical protein